MNLRHKAVAAVTAGLMIAAPLTPLTALADKQSDLAAAASQLASLGEELSGLENQLGQASADLEETKYEIDNKTQQITETQEDLDEAKATLSGRMRSSYKTGGTNYLELVFGSQSLSDLIGRIYYADKVAESDAQAIGEVRTLENQLASEKSELEAKQSEQEELVASTEQQVSAYQSKVSEAQAYYNNLDAQVQAELAAQAAANAATQAAMNAVNSNNGGNNNGGNNGGTTDGGQQNTNSGNDDSGDSGYTYTGGGQSYGASGGGLGAAYDCIGAPYVYGAAGPSSFDCSGLVCYCYGYARGRTTYAMISSLQSTGSWKTSMDQLEVGDLVFPHEGHVGIYIGGGQMIDASPGTGVSIRTVGGSFMGGGPL